MKLAEWLRSQKSGLFATKADMEELATWIESAPIDIRGAVQTGAFVAINTLFELLAILAETGTIENFEVLDEEDL